MKKLALISAIAISGLLYNTADAQFGIHVGICLFPHRIFVAPGPVAVNAPVYQEPVANDYSNNDDFYYLPDVGAYYSVDEQLYYYQDGDQWVATAYLPGIYHDFDWRYARRVEIHEQRPFMHNDFFRNKYQGYDCDLVNNHDHFREGFNYHYNNDAYNAPQRFNDPDFNYRVDNNRSGYDQQFNNRGNDNHIDNRGHAGFDHNNNSGQQFGQNRDMGNKAGQQVNQTPKQDQGNRNNQDRLARNEMPYNGHRDIKTHF